MVDQAIEYKSLLNKVDIMINNVDTLGMDTTRYKETLKKIINEVESSTKVSKTKWGNNASMVLICDYGLGIKKLRALELELSQYEVYFKAINSCEYLLMKIDRINSVDSKEEVKSYANEIIESLKSIKFSSTIHYSDEKKIVEKIYDVAYRIIKLEIMTMGSSQVYEYIKKYDVDTYFLDNCIRKEIEAINLKDEKNKKIKEKTYELSRNGLDANYFDIELIKLLICNSNDIDLKENIIKELNSLKKELNDIARTYNKALLECSNCLSKEKRTLIDLEIWRKRILIRVTSTVVSLGVIVGGLFGINYLVKKTSTNQVYPKTTTTYSDEYGKDVSEGYSLVESDEQDKTYIKVYRELIDEIGADFRDIYTYDVSDVYLDNIENYLNLDYSKLDYEKDTVRINQGDYSNQNGYVEVIQTTIDRNKEESYLHKGVYQLNSILSYISYILLIVIFENIVYIASRGEGYLGIFTNMHQLLKYNMGEYNKYKVKHRKELQECKRYLNSMLEELSKYEELKLRFNELYDQNKYLLDNPEKLLNKIDELSQELSKEEIKGKLKSLKRI